MKRHIVNPGKILLADAYDVYLTVHPLTIWQNTDGTYELTGALEAHRMDWAELNRQLIEFGKELALEKEEEDEDLCLHPVTTLSKN